ncbi:L-alanine-DL-glutamate epimerase-like enolase superfamily enzyme [Paraburkholderia sp. RAU6.4a]|uniref:enolase C-terminal domain-like protein n=1 Tax=Paraburkholderia sp. RAU6.4a TaxID=2991067 RepID=UPI003D208863
MVENLDVASLLGTKIAISIGAAEIPITPFRALSGFRNHVTVFYALIRDGNDRCGFGHVQHMTREASLDAAHAAQELLRAQSIKLSTLIAIERSEERHFGRDSDNATRAAACAISLAAWDLLGKILDVPVAHLWGGFARPVPCYSSYHLAFAADDDLEAAATHCFEENFTRAKMIVGAQPFEVDIKRVERMLMMFGADNLAIDALRRWTPQQANDFVKRLSAPLFWVEDPVAYPELNRVSVASPVAVGEISTSVSELLLLAESGATHMLLDMGLLGGPLRQLEAARILNRIGTRVGSHAYPYYSAHIACGVDDHLPVEVLDWGDCLFHKVPRPDGVGSLAVSGPGFGLDVDRSFLENRCHWSVEF